MNVRDMRAAEDGERYLEMPGYVHVDMTARRRLYALVDPHLRHVNVQDVPAWSLAPSTDCAPGFAYAFRAFMVSSASAHGPGLAVVSRSPQPYATESLRDAPDDEFATFCSLSQDPGDYRAFVSSHYMSLVMQLGQGTLKGCYELPVCYEDPDAAPGQLGIDILPGQSGLAITALGYLSAPR